MNKKIKVLVLPSDHFGVGSFRFVEPHVELQKQFQDEFDIEISYETNFSDITSLSKYDIIFGNKDMCSLEVAKITIPQLREKGIKVIIDIDDSFNLHPKHPHYHYAKQTKMAERITQMLSLADYITTTTERFASEIRKYNKNVIVFANGIDPTNKKFKNVNSNSDKVRILWLGGSSHLVDLQLLKSSIDSINEKFKGKIQMILCGFDLRGFVNETDKNGQQHQRPIKPEETCWYEYEKIFTSDYRYLSPEYKKFLLEFKQEEFPDVENEQYRRVWTKPMSTYSLNYNYADIVLAPLEINHFNEMKSQLKIEEAGFFHKPIIATDISPYQIDIKHGDNGFLVNNNSNTKNWKYYLTKLINDDVLRKEMGEKLYETVKDKYDIRNISRSRAEWYREIIK